MGRCQSKRGGDNSAPAIGFPVNSGNDNVKDNIAMRNLRASLFNNYLETDINQTYGRSDASLCVTKLLTPGVAREIAGEDDSARKLWRAHKRSLLPPEKNP